MDISCAFATSVATPGHVELAEQLGYRRAWLYDSTAVYPDVWMILGRCAGRTSRIGLGPAVLVPSLRHPMVNAAAIAALAELAPGRVAAAVGAGFTGRRALDRSWSSCWTCGRRVAVFARPARSRAGRGSVSLYGCCEWGQHLECWALGPLSTQSR